MSVVNMSSARTQSDPELEFIGHLAAQLSGRLTRAGAEDLGPIVADISMPCLDGIGAAVQIRRGNPRARIVFVTMFGDAAVVERGLATGALGYVLKVAAGEELVPAVHAALAGLRYVSRDLGGVEGGAGSPTAT